MDEAGKSGIPGLPDRSEVSRALLSAYRDDLGEVGPMREHADRRP